MYDDRDDDYFPSGDPRRCPYHPREVTSSSDGMFDTPCGACEFEMDAERDAEFYGEVASDLLGCVPSGDARPVSHSDDDLPF
mgnify:CR=1 FL=1